MLHWQDWVEDIGLSMDYEERSFARRMLESTLLATVVMQGGGGAKLQPMSSSPEPHQRDFLRVKQICRFSLGPGA